MSVVRTARLQLRAVDEQDVPAIVDGCSDPEVARFIPVVPHPYSQDDARRWLAGASDRSTAARELSLALTRLDRNELLGVVTVRLRAGGSIGYWLRPCARGHGLMAEAVSVVAGWATREHRVHGLFITAHVERRLVSACAGVFAPLTAGMGLAGFTRS